MGIADATNFHSPKIVDILATVGASPRKSRDTHRDFERQSKMQKNLVIPRYEIGGYFPYFCLW